MTSGTKTTLSTLRMGMFEWVPVIQIVDNMTENEDEESNEEHLK